MSMSKKLAGIILCVFIFATLLMASGRGGGSYLVKIDVPDSFALKKNLVGMIDVILDMKGFVLAIVTEKERRALEQKDFRIRILDTDPNDKEYFFISGIREGDAERIGEAARILLKDRGSALAQISHGEALAISTRYGVDIAPLFKDPITIREQIGLAEKRAAFAANPAIVGMVDLVSQADIESVASDLVNFGTRAASSQGGIDAQNYIFQKFQSLGIEDVELQDFDSRHDNVIATIPGLARPDEIYVVGGHYDSSSFSSQEAPGADDNASGTTAVIEIARVMSQYDFEATVKFIAFGAEELGLVGSRAYAQAAAAAGDDILGYVNLDMHGYLASGDTMDTDVISNTQSDPLMNLAFDVWETYVPILPIVEGSLFGATSDHASFWSAGYAAIFPFEDSGQYSPYIHTKNDTIGLSLNNFEFLTLGTKGSLALMATLAAPFEISIRHTPLPITDETAEPYDVTATILSKDPLNEDSVTLYYNDGTGFTQVPMEATGTADEYSAQIPPYPVGTTIHYFIYAEDVYGKSATSPADAPASTHKFSIVTIMAALDFEPNNGGFTGTGEWAWGTPAGGGPSAAHSGTKAWGTDLVENYDNRVNYTLDSPPYDLTGSTNAYLELYHWYKTEAYYDGGNVKISTDGGATFTILEPEGGYPEESISSGNEAIPGEPAFAGSSGGWEVVTFDLYAYLGHTVTIRFHFGSDLYVRGLGWFIDDFTIYGSGGTPQDTDGDGIPDAADNCPAVPNPYQVDSDDDGAGDACDNCLGLPNPDQGDMDGDGFGDACDVCPEVSDPDQVDGDADGWGFECDCDDEAPDVNPGMEEVPDNGIDDDCDGRIDESCFVGFIM